MCNSIFGITLCGLTVGDRPTLDLLNSLALYITKGIHKSNFGQIVWNELHT